MKRLHVSKAYANRQADFAVQRETCGGLLSQSETHIDAPLRHEWDTGDVRVDVPYDLTKAASGAGVGHGIGATQGRNHENVAVFCRRRRPATVANRTIESSVRMKMSRSPIRTDPQSRAGPAVAGLLAGQVERYPRRARSALRITARSIASCRRAPATGGR